MCCLALKYILVILHKGFSSEVYNLLPETGITVVYWTAIGGNVLHEYNSDRKKWVNMPQYN